MLYDGLIIRPPNEAGSLILQVTVGCSHNRCTFCPAYKKKRFRIKKTEEILRDIDLIDNSAAENIRRVFLCDGDPLIMPHANLMKILHHLSLRLHRLQRVGIYGNAGSVLKKSVKDLTELKNTKLGIVYLGLESGDQVTLERIKKGATPEEMIESAKRLKLSGIKLNVTVLLGVAGKERSRVHAKETIMVLNRMEPNHVGALTLMLVPGTPVYNEFKKGKFTLPGKFELIEELKIMIEGSQLENCLFYSNHASNYFPIKARLPRDKETILRQLNDVILSRDKSALRLEFMRGL